MDDLRNIHLNELVERFNLVTDDLFTIRLQNECLQNVAIIGKESLFSSHCNSWIADLSVIFEINFLGRCIFRL